MRSPRELADAWKALESELGSTAVAKVTALLDEQADYIEANDAIGGGLIHASRHRDGVLLGFQANDGSRGKGLNFSTANARLLFAWLATHL